MRFTPAKGTLVVIKTDKKRTVSNITHYLCEIVMMNADDTYDGFNEGDYVEVCGNKLVQIYDYKNNKLSNNFAVDVFDVNGVYSRDE
jgi:hypothetical protein